MKMIGHDIYRFAEELWPLNRSLTGVGVRETLGIFRKMLPELQLIEIASGTKVFDWTVPKEWRVSSAYIIDPNGRKICDFFDNNLHLVGYSTPFRGLLNLQDLNQYLHSIEDQPSAIPYVTSYYEKRWGFCLSHEQRANLPNGDYSVVVDTDLFDGSMTLGELILPGKSEKEILISTYICHPSMANNELSGPAVVTYLSKWLSTLEHREYTYRIVFLPETIGAIAYLSSRLKEMQKLTIAGFNVSCVGDDRAYSYLPTRRGDTLSDLVAKHVLRWIDPDFISYEWFDRGSDERQYCSPGVDLPIASMHRTKFGEYPEYHTSLDTLGGVVTPQGLDGGYWMFRRALELIERNKIYVNSILCEPNMGKRGLYPTLSTKRQDKRTSILMDFLSLCDGDTLLVDAANLMNVPAWDLYPIVDELLAHKLIKEK